MKRCTILVTAIGSFAGELVVSRLKEYGYRVIGCDIYPKEWIALSKEVDSFYQVPKSFDSELYINKLIEICHVENVMGIIPLTDVEIDILCRNRELLEDKGIALYVSDTEIVKICRNKRLMYKYIDDNSLNIQCIPTYSEDEMLIGNAKFPVVCKPEDGRSSQGLYVLNNHLDWEYFCKKVNLSKYIIQKKIDGTVVAADVIRDKYNNVVTVLRKELLRTINGAGTTVEVFEDDQLSAQCIALANALKILGCVCFEFILDNNGNYLFLECNPRFGGGSKFTLLAGYDCVINHLQAFENNKIEAFKLNKSIIIARRYNEYIMT